MSNAFERAVQRGDGRLFDTVTLRNQTAQTDSNGDPKRDAHGNIKWDSATESDVDAEVVYRGTPQFERRVSGVDADVDAVVWVEDTGGFDASFEIVFGDQLATDGRVADGQRATRILADGKRYVVRDTFAEGNGRLRCHGYLEE